MAGKTSDPKKLYTWAISAVCDEMKGLGFFVHCNNEREDHMGADLNAKAENDVTPLHIAVISGNIEIAKFLVSMGADASAKTKKGNSPLDIAKEKENAAMIEYLESLNAQGR